MRTCFWSGTIAISRHPSSSEGHLPTTGWNPCLSGANQAGAALICGQRKALPSRCAPCVSRWRRTPKRQEGRHRPKAGRSSERETVRLEANADDDRHSEDRTYRAVSATEIKRRGNRTRRDRTPLLSNAKNRPLRLDICSSNETRFSGHPLVGACASRDRSISCG